MITEKIAYNTLPGVRISNLIEIEKSPKHYRYLVDHPRKHLLTLEPERESECVVWDHETESGNVSPRRGKSWDAFVTENKGKIITTPSEIRAARAIARAVRSDPIVERAGLLRGGRAEYIMRWEDGEVQCKGRVDYVTRGCVTDLKTTNNLARFQYMAKRLAYHVKMAWYGMGHEACDPYAEGYPELYIIAVESQPPHDVAVYHLSRSEVDEGLIRARDALETLKKCLETDTWPGFAGGEMIRSLYPTVIDDGIDWSNTDDTTEQTD